LLQTGFTPAFHYGIPWGFTKEALAALDLTGQTAIVTGANAGIGYALSEYLYQLGAEVTMVCRNPLKCLTAAEKIRSDNADSKGELVTGTMDTETLVSVKDFALNYLIENQGAALDMLFLNAGTVFADPDSKCVPLSVDGVEKIFATNYLGHHLLFRLLELALKQSKLARVVSTSSHTSFSTFSYKVATDLETLNGCSEPYRVGPYNFSYGQSKLAQILWTKYLTRRHLGMGSNIIVNAFHPGVCATEIFDKSLSEGKAHKIIKDLTKWVEHEVMWTASEGALTGMYLGAAVDRLVQNNVRGKYFHPQSQEVVNELALDTTLQDNLWEFSEELIKDFLVVEEKPTEATDRSTEKLEKPQATEKVD